MRLEEAEAIRLLADPQIESGEAYSRRVRLGNSSEVHQGQCYVHHSEDAAK